MTITPLSPRALSRLFAAAMLTVAALFIVFLGYVYVAFSGPLIGDVRSAETPDLLTGLQPKKFETAIGRLEARKHLPDIPSDLPNPFDAPKAP